MTALALSCAFLGLLIGSFLNVVVWRVPRGLSVVRPPSACPGCDAPIRNRDNVPVLSWMLLRGRCRDCAEPISVRYPLVEAGTGALFAAMALRFGFDAVLPAYLYLAAVGIALALIDLDTQRLPDVLTLPSYAVAAVLLGVAAAVNDEGGSLLRAGLSALAVGVFFYVVWFVYPGGMGYGDVKLSPVLGAYLGWVSAGAVAVGIFVGFLLGALVGIAVMALGKGGRKTKLPFGPFMILGALIGIFWGADIATAYLDATVG